MVCGQASRGASAASGRKKATGWLLRWSSSGGCSWQVAARVRVDARVWSWAVALAIGVSQSPVSATIEVSAISETRLARDSPWGSIGRDGGGRGRSEVAGPGAMRGDHGLVRALSLPLGRFRKLLRSDPAGAGPPPAPAQDAARRAAALSPPTVSARDSRRLSVTCGRRIHHARGWLPSRSSGSRRQQPCPTDSRERVRCPLLHDAAASADLRQRSQALPRVRGV